MGVGEGVCGVEAGEGVSCLIIEVMTFRAGRAGGGFCGTSIELGTVRSLTGFVSDAA